LRFFDGVSSVKSTKSSSCNECLLFQRYISFYIHICMSSLSVLLCLYMHEHVHTHACAHIHTHTQTYDGLEMQ
jgi:hypothetical protein